MAWRFAASTACSLNAPVDTTLRELAQAGVRAVELAMPPRHFDPWRHEQVAEFAHCLRELRMAPIAVHAPFGGLLDLSDPNPHHRFAAIGAVLSAASALRDLGGSKVVVHVSDAPRTSHDLDERLARAADSLRLLARACAHMDAQLLVETPCPAVVGGLADEFASVMRPLDATVGVCLDIGHVTLGGQWDDLLGAVADRVRHVHAHDHHGSADDHLPPGDGRVDWQHVRSSLAAAGYQGWVVIELSRPAGPLVEFMSGALRRTRALFEATEV